MGSRDPVERHYAELVCDLCGTAVELYTAVVGAWCSHCERPLRIRYQRTWHGSGVTLEPDEVRT
jgi:hypothetical protein